MARAWRRSGSAAGATSDVARRDTAYNQLLFAIEQLRVIQHELESKQTHVDYARNRRAAGVATELEVLRAEVDLENARAEALRAENDVAAARALAQHGDAAPDRRLRSSPRTVLRSCRFRSSFDRPSKRRSRPTRASVAAHQERVQTLLVDVAAGDQSRALSSTGRTGSAGTRDPQISSTPNYSRWSASFNAQGPVLRRQANGRPCRAGELPNETRVTQQIAALESQVRLEVQSAVDALALADRTYQAAELNVNQARRACEMTEANYKLGAATQLDVVDAQRRLRQAENIRNLSLYTHANARAALRFVMARDPLD